MSMQTFPTDTAQSLEIYSPKRTYSVTGLSGTTVWRLRQRAEFPEPIELSPGRIGYRRVDIERWIASRRTRG